MVKKLKTKHTHTHTHIHTHTHTHKICLGVILDEHLKFKTQIGTVEQKVARGTGLLPKLRHYVTQ